MTGIGDRISNRVQGLFRSWWFFVGFLVWTSAWWAFVGPHFAHDVYPWIAWTTITTLVTQVDVLIVGIGQKKSQQRDATTLRALIGFAESDQAKMAAILAIGDAQQALLRSTKTELEDLQELIEDATRAKMAALLAIGDAQARSMADDQWFNASAKLREAIDNDIHADQDP